MITGTLTALWLGILTSISPCPLATNIAAISYISRRINNPRYVIWAGLLYTLGRVIAYAVLGAIIVMSLTSISSLSYFLEKYMNRLLGPILIIVGMFLLELIKFTKTSGTIISEQMRSRIDTWGIGGAICLGILFALAFCPVSAALFFGSLIPVSLKYSSKVLLPSSYGIGTGLPVLVFAMLIAFGAKLIGKTYERMKLFEFWARRITGVIFICVGIYYSLVYIFGVL